MRFLILSVLLLVGCGGWNNSEKPSNDPNALHELLIGVDIVSEDEISSLTSFVQSQMPKLDLGAVDMTIVDQDEVRQEPYKSQYGCSGNYLGCTDTGDKVSHSLIGWYGGSVGFLYDDAITIAHELAHVWLYQTTGDSDRHHKHIHIFGADDNGKFTDRNALVFQIANQWYEQEKMTYRNGGE